MKKSFIMKKSIVFILTLVMCLAVFSGCGEKGPDVTGKYTLTSCKAYGEDYEGDNQWIELKKGGKGTYYSGDYSDGSEGISFDLEWKLDGETFTGKVKFLGAREDCNGTLKDGVLSVTYGSYEYVMTKENN